MKVPKAVQLDSPVLRVVAAPVLPIDMESLAHGLEVALKRTDRALGLALPQLGISMRGFVIAPRAFRNSSCFFLRYRYCFNPEILAAIGEKETDEEGCLSLPGQLFNVARYPRIDVRYRDTYNNEIKETFTGLPARVFQHELDHLDGILIDDTRHAVASAPA